MEEVLAKYFSGNATKDEISLVENWRSESESNVEAFFEAKSAWLISDIETPPPSHILDKILKEPQAKQVPFIMQGWVKYASAAVLVLAISLLFILNQNGASGTLNESLADGSKIALHENSSLEIINFNENIREVRVTGKAYFDIERDETRPFIIHTDNAKVQVLGTSFLVDTYGSKTEVSVESGVVELSKNLNGSSEVSVKLVKGETGLVTNMNAGIIKKNNNNLNYLAWKTKVIAFNESSMQEVKQVIEDVYGIDITFENPAFLECKLTAKFNKKKPKDAIEIIARTFGIEYEYSNGKAVLKGKGC
ncbi:FecR family protein [Ekhidna sp. To15]|uniref:FecR family protein n=1 Tax=Ekhidna sp. To15 TaxID=3395267 RepID=UPI003F51F01F